MTEPEFAAGGVIEAEPALVGETATDSVLPVAAALPEPPTREQMYAALHDDATPMPVKRFLREQLYGAARGRREDRSRVIRTLRTTLRPNVLAESTDEFGGHIVYKMGFLTSNKAKKPKGMSVKQWKACKRAVRQEVQAKHAAAV